MGYKKIKDSVVAAGKDPNNMVRLQKVMIFEDYFVDTIYPTINQEGYNHVMTGATVTEDGKSIDKLIMQFDNETGYKMDMIVYLEGDRPFMVKKQ